MAEWMTTSAPCSIGRMRYGVATVLSTNSGTPASWATSAIPAMSRTFWSGLEIVSPKKSLVSGRTAARHSSRSAWSLTKVVVMPSLGSV